MSSARYQIDLFNIINQKSDYFDIIINKNHSCVLNFFIKSKNESFQNFIIQLSLVKK